MPLGNTGVNNRYAPYNELAATWRTCLELAWEAHCSGSLPIAAVVVDEQNKVIAQGRNRLAEDHENSPHLPGTPYLTGTPLAHAEVNALLQLGYRTPGPRPVLFTTTEPCPLCMGAARMSGIGRIVFAARDPWAGCASMAHDVPYLKRSGPTVNGPELTLEAPLIAWQVAFHLSHRPDGSPFLDTYKECLPEWCKAGKRLAERGTLSALAERKASSSDVWTALVESLVR
jgi:tRNA(adenine34) deaminase